MASVFSVMVPVPLALCRLHAPRGVSAGKTNEGGIGGCCDLAERALPRRFRDLCLMRVTRSAARRTTFVSAPERSRAITCR